MTYRNSHSNYGKISKGFHWLIFLLILGMIIFGFVMGEVPKEYKGMVYNIHKLTGISILILMILRLIWALMNPKPKLPSHTPTWEIAMERLVHFLLYAIIIAMPISGWVMASAAGKAPKLLGSTLMLPVPQSEGLAHFFGGVHEFLAWSIIVVVSLHILAALKHHVINKDNVLKRMMPRSS